jgi:mannose-1-phosphate guanylyltransferase/mannose-6-phosphate isomerase
MESRKLYAVIMAGGKGTRFWPLSREKFPKQFLRFAGEKTLLQATVDRLLGTVPAGNFMIVTTGTHSELANWQTRDALCEGCTVVEPEGKNTAAAIALAAFKIRKKSKDALMLVLPADHYIKDPGAFIATVHKAIPVARAGGLVTFGIVPTRPETGYGYIKAGRRIRAGIHKVERFVEKPDARKAAALLKEGSYLWNSGIFLFRAVDIIGEFRKYMPGLFKTFAGISRALNTDREPEALKAAYGELESQSIDFGIMEHSRRAAVVRAEFGWSDIGSWNSLEDVMGKDASGNVISGNAVHMDTRDSIIFSSGRLIAAIGLSGMVVVDTTDATLICPKDRVQEVKDLVSKLREEGKEEYLLPKVEERPWGHFFVLEKGQNYQIKHLCLKPKARLSLQSHSHRSEHWIVVSGVARVRRGDEEYFVPRNESTFIPATVKHRLENPGLIPLRIIEIQSGEHLGEEDITRFDDIYGRRKG